MAATHEIRIGTRGSQLALWQADEVARRLAAAGATSCRIVTIRTSGDRLQEAPLSEVGGKRLFVKEIEEALLHGDVDIAVHSSKDMTAILPDGLVIGGVLPREDPRDALVLRLPSDSGAPSSAPACATLEDAISRLGQSPIIGTGSVRRVAQLMRLFPMGRFEPVRGNLDTRLRKLDGGGHDALVLAAAGLHRLGFASRISMLLPIEACVPAPGQGIVAIEIREDDERIRGIAAAVTDGATAAALSAERAVVAALGAGCQTPLGAYARLVDADEIDVTAIVVATDGGRAVRASSRGPRANAAALGAEVGARLIADGAGELLADAQRRHRAVGYQGA